MLNYQRVIWKSPEWLMLIQLPMYLRMDCIFLWFFHLPMGFPDMFAVKFKKKQNESAINDHYQRLKSHITAIKSHKITINFLFQPKFFSKRRGTSRSSSMVRLDLWPASEAFEGPTPRCPGSCRSWDPGIACEMWNMGHHGKSWKIMGKSWKIMENHLSMEHHLSIWVNHLSNGRSSNKNQRVNIHT